MLRVNFRFLTLFDQVMYIAHFCVYVMFYIFFQFETSHKVQLLNPPSNHNFNIDDVLKIGFIQYSFLVTKEIERKNTCVSKFAKLSKFEMTCYIQSLTFLATNLPILLSTPQYLITFYLDLGANI